MEHTSSASTASIEIAPGEVDFNRFGQTLIVVTYASNHPSYTATDAPAKAIVDLTRSKAWRDRLEDEVYIHYIDISHWPSIGFTELTGIYNLRYGRRGYGAIRLPDISLYASPEHPIETLSVELDRCFNIEEWGTQAIATLNTAHREWDSRIDRVGGLVRLLNDLGKVDEKERCHALEKVTQCIAWLPYRDVFDSSESVGSAVLDSLEVLLDLQAEGRMEGCGSQLSMFLRTVLPLLTPDESSAARITDLYPGNAEGVLVALLDSALERLEFNKWSITYKRRFDRDFGMRMSRSYEQLLPVLRIAATAYAEAPQETYSGDARSKLYRALKILFAQHLELRYPKNDVEEARFLKDLATIVDRVQTLPEGELASDEFDLYSDVRLMDHYLNTKLAR